MDKKQVRLLVLKDGKPLALNKFSWDAKTRTFASDEDGLVIDFSDVSHCTITAGWDCAITAGWRSTITARSCCTITAGCCTIDACDDCTINAGSGCTINAGSDCAINTGWDCTINAGSGCTINAGRECAIVNRNEFEVIVPNDGDVIQLCPSGISGHLVNGLYNGKPHIVVDGILSEVISKRGNVYRVINHGETEKTYLVRDGDHWAHGKTLADARESLIYKKTDRDTSAYNGMTLDSVVTFAEAIAMYRTITGACAEGCEYFVSQNADKRKDSYTIAELIELTKGQYNADKLQQFFKGSK